MHTRFSPFIRATAMSTIDTKKRIKIFIIDIIALKLVWESTSQVLVAFFPALLARVGGFFELSDAIYLNQQRVPDAVNRLERFLTVG